MSGLIDRGPATHEQALDRLEQRAENSRGDRFTVTIELLVDGPARCVELLKEMRPAELVTWKVEGL